MNIKLQHDIGLPIREIDSGEETRQQTEPEAAADSEPFAVLQRGVRALRRSWSGQRVIWEKLAAWRRATAMAREAARPRVPLTSQDD